jgi:hypothetical protein
MSASLVLHSPASRALQHSAIPALRKLQVEERDLELVLTGAVSSYYLKQLAQEAVMPFVGGRELKNCVDVISA